MDDFVGFSAYSTVDQSPDNGIDLTFYLVISNEGSGYNGASEFRCPISGFYNFFFALNVYIDYNSNYDSCRVDIMVGGEIKATVNIVH